MTTNLTDIEIKLLEQIQHGLPMAKTPYRDVADSIGVEVEQVVSILNDWNSDGRLRRMGAIVNHFRVGLGAGAMVVWNVPGDRIEDVGNIFASYEQVSHAYQRSSCNQWKYNLYTMVHSGDKESLEAVVKQMSKRVGVVDYQLLETVAELKKVPPTYVYKKEAR